MKENDFLTRACVPIRLACLTRADWPITISLWYIYIYGRKILLCYPGKCPILKYLSNNSKCGFEVTGDSPPYRGVRGWGFAKLNETRGSEILHILIKKYLKDEKSQLADFLLRRAEDEVAIEIKPLSVFHYDYTSRMNGIKVNTDK